MVNQNRTDFGLEERISLFSAWKEGLFPMREAERYKDEYLKCLPMAGRHNFSLNLPIFSRSP